MAIEIPANVTHPDRIVEVDLLQWSQLLASAKPPTTAVERKVFEDLKAGSERAAGIATVGITVKAIRLVQSLQPSPAKGKAVAGE